MMRSGPHTVAVTSGSLRGCPSLPLPIGPTFWTVPEASPKNLRDPRTRKGKESKEYAGVAGEGYLGTLLVPGPGAG